MEAKRLIVTKAQLNEYVENKKAEKVFYEIVESLYNNKKYLKENISIEKANYAIIENFKRKGLVTGKVEEMLVKHKIINEKNKIL